MQICTAGEERASCCASRLPVVRFVLWEAVNGKVSAHLQSSAAGRMHARKQSPWLTLGRQDMMYLYVCLQAPAAKGKSGEAATGNHNNEKDLK